MTDFELIVLATAALQSTEEALRLTAFADLKQKTQVDQALAAIYHRYPALKKTKGN